MNQTTSRRVGFDQVVVLNGIWGDGKQRCSLLTLTALMTLGCEAQAFVQCWCA